MIGKRTGRRRFKYLNGSWMVEDVVWKVPVVVLIVSWKMTGLRLLVVWYLCKDGKEKEEGLL